MKSISQTDPMIVAVRPFKTSARTVDRIALALGLYVMFALYPAYAFLRIWWTGETDILSPLNIFVALLTALIFGLFARAMIRHTLGIQKQDETARPHDRDSQQRPFK